jgi:hypothetical protein
MKLGIKIIVTCTICIFTILLVSCGDKMGLSEFPLTGPDPNVSDTSYVQQSPTWDQFNQPEDILVGYEPLIYVADTKNNRIAQLDLSGDIIGTQFILNPIAITQDHNFDLLVIGDTVTIIGDTLSIVYRIKTVPAGGVITNAGKITLIVSDYPTPLIGRERRFTGISTYPDNTYLITRAGPNNIGGIDPDNAILKVTGIDVVTNVEVLSGFQPTGNGIYSIEKTSSVSTVPNDPTDFIITRNTSDFGFKVEWFEYDDVNGTFDPRFLPESNVDIVKLQLGTPEDVTQDNNFSVFVVDSSKDSLYKFNSLGRLMPESFGGNGFGVNQLNSPKGVAFFDKVLYIADTGNNRIVRYKLSTDLN